MGHSSIRIKVRRRKVANLAAYSKQHTVNNIKNGIGDGDRKVPIKEGTEDILDYSWKNPKEGYPQPKRLHKGTKRKKWKNHQVYKIYFRQKDYKEFPTHLFHRMGKAAFMEKMVQHKINKWEKKNPKPIKEDTIQTDLFEKDFMIPWKAKREIALERIRDFVVSVYDKLPLIGRYEEGNNKFTEKPIAELKDVNGEGHRVNELDEKSKLLDKAQKATNKEKAKNAKLVATNLKDHKRKKGRIILPEAA